MKSVLITLLVLMGLLLQTVAWVLPAQRLGQTERLAHQVAHALDHGHHQHGDPHDTRGHTMDATLQPGGGLDHPFGGSDHGPRHTHASEGV